VENNFAKAPVSMTFLNTLIAKLSLPLASKILMLFPTAFLVFHILIIAGVLPRNIVWGGQLTDRTFLPLEILALTINLLLMLVGGVAGGFVKSALAITIVDRIKWFLFYFVVVNTVLALFSTTKFELFLTPITAIYALCLYRINTFPDGSSPSR